MTKQIKTYTVEQAHFNFEDSELIVLKKDHDEIVKKLVDGLKEIKKCHEEDPQALYYIIPKNLNEALK